MKMTQNPIVKAGAALVLTAGLLTPVPRARAADETYIKSSGQVGLLTKDDRLCVIIGEGDDC